MFFCNIVNLFVVNNLMRISKKKILFLPVKFVVIILLLITAFFLFDFLQTWLGHRLASYLSEKAGVEVKIDALNFDIFGNINLSDVLVKDFDDDTLLYTSGLQIRLRDLSFKKHYIYFSEAEIGTANFYLRVNKNGVVNLTQLIDSLSSTGDTLNDTTSQGFNFYVGNITMKNSRFRLLNFQDFTPDSVGVINFSNLDFKNIFAKINNFRVIGENVNFDLEHLSFYDRSGFSVKRLFAIFSLNNQKFKLLSVKAVTNNSYLSLDSLVFSASGNKNVFSGLTDNTLWKLYFRGTAIAPQDLNFFSVAVSNNLQPLWITGLVTGRLSDLHLKNLNCEWGDLSKVNLSGSITGLPDIENTLFYLNIDKLKTYNHDLEKMIGGFSNDTSFKLPEMLGKAGVVTYNGNLSGFYNDFVVYGVLNTDVGVIKTDLGLKDKDSLLLSGKIETENFDLGGLFSAADSIIGLLSMNGDIEGSVQKTGEFKFDLNADLTKTELFGHDYKDVKVDGELRNTSFDGEIVVRDTALNMVFLGAVDFSDKNAVYDFTADVKKAVIPIIYPYAKTGIDSVRFLLKSRLRGNGVLNAKGDVELYQIGIFGKGKKYLYNSFIAAINEKQDKGREVNITSSLLSGNISYKLNNLNDFEGLFFKFASNYYSYLPVKEVDLGDDAYLSLNLNLKLTSILNDYLLPFDVSKNSKLNLYVDGKDSVDFNFFADTLKSGGAVFNDSRFYMYSQGKMLTSGFQTKRIEYSGFYIDSALFDANIFKDTANFELSWNTNIDSSVYSADLQAQAVVSDTNSIIIDFVPSYFIIADTMWYVNDWHCDITDSVINIKDFVLNRESEYVSIDGKVSGNKTDSLHIVLEALSLNHFYKIFEKAGLSISGVLYGNLISSSVLSHPVVSSDLTVDKFVFDNEKFGKLKVNTSWVDSSKIMNANVYLLRQKLKTLELAGFYDSKTDNLNFKLYTRRFLMKHLQYFLKGILSDIRGIADGEVSIKGTLSHPLLEGVINTKKVSFTVDYLKTYYSFTAPLYINYGGLFFKNIDVFDSEGNKAKVNLAITHNNFSGLKYDIKVNSDKIMYLNTTEKDNSLFFGKVYGSGSVNVSGDLEGLKVLGDVTTMKNTKFNLMLESPEDAEEYGFVTFVSDNKMRDTVRLVSKTSNKVTGIEMNLKIKATEDALVRIIFDAKSGDIIKSVGNGDIEMNLTKTGDLSIKGDYVITSGSYLFTLQNMINKRFQIKKGSYIKWNGDPYKAFLDIQAVYKIKTSLYDLTLDSNDRKNVYVGCLMNITNRLDDPKITFGIDVKSNNPRAKSILANMSQEELTKQIIMLMVMGRFYTPEKFHNRDVYAEGGQTNAFGLNASELLSEQLSYWLSQITNDFDVGVKYIPGNELTRSELEVALSTQMFNDKLIVNGNVNMGGNVPTASGVAGDVSVELKINPKGTIRLKGFNKTNDDLLLYQDAPYTQGIGVFYTENFNSIRSLFGKYYSGIIEKLVQRNKELIKKFKKKKN